jgi:SAM-dependent methyltransferase
VNSFSVNNAIHDRVYFEKWYSDRSSKDYRNLLGQIVQNFDPGKVLDVGAGVGHFVELLSQWGVDCEGVDYSLDAVKLAKERNSELNIIQHDVSCGLPYPNESFAVIVLNQIIAHLGHEVILGLLKECYRVIKPGGGILITGPSVFNEKVLAYDKSIISPFRYSTLKQLLNNYGFKDIGVDINKSRQFPFLGRRSILLSNVLYKISKKDMFLSSANFIGIKEDINQS